MISADRSWERVARNQPQPIVFTDAMRLLWLGRLLCSAMVMRNGSEGTGRQVCNPIDPFPVYMENINETYEAIGITIGAWNHDPKN